MYDRGVSTAEVIVDIRQGGDVALRVNGASGRSGMVSTSSIGGGGMDDDTTRTMISNNVLLLLQDLHHHH